MLLNDDYVNELEAHARRDRMQYGEALDLVKHCRALEARLVRATSALESAADGALTSAGAKSALREIEEMGGDGE